MCIVFTTKLVLIPIYNLKKKKPYWTPMFCFGHGGEMSELIFKGTFYNWKCSRAEGSQHLAYICPCPRSLWSRDFLATGFPLEHFLMRARNLMGTICRRSVFSFFSYTFKRCFFFISIKEWKRLNVSQIRDVAKCDSVNGIFSSYILTLTYMIIDVDFL